MKYPDELCQLIIENLELVEEGPKVVEQITQTVFAAINGRIKKRVEEFGDWEGLYDLVTGKDEDESETSFWPQSWPKNENGQHYAWYTLCCEGAEEEASWVELALGQRGLGLWLAFGYEHGEWGIGVRQYKNAIARLFAESELADYGLKFDGISNIYIPFTLDASVVKNNYPDFEEALKSVDVAMDKLKSVHHIFDQAVRDLGKRK